MIFGLLVQKFGSFIKTKLYVSRGDFRRKKVFGMKSFFSIIWSLWADDFQDSGEKCRKCHQSCILRVGRNIVPKHCFGEQKFITFGISAKKTRDFGGKLLTWLSNLPFTCPEEHFEGRKIGEKIISINFLTLGEKVSNFSPKVPSRAVRTAF